MLQVGARGPKLASTVLFYPPPTCVSIMLLGWVTTLHPQDIVWCSGRAPCPAGRQEHPPRDNQRQGVEGWALKCAVRIRSRGIMRAEVLACGVSPLNEMKHSPEHAAFALETESQGKRGADPDCRGSPVRGAPPPQRWP